MRNNPTLEEWNWHVLMLGQALIGAVSENFRMVSLRFAVDFWEVIVVLKSQDVLDEDVIMDIADDTSIFLEDVRDQLSANAMKRIETRTHISTKTLVVENSETVRVVFKKREN